MDHFLTHNLKFIRSREEGCLCVVRKGDHWIINYVDNFLYYSNDDKFREDFESLVKKKFNLSLLGKAKWFLGMKIKQTSEHITLDQDQYVKNIVSRFEKSFKQQFKRKDIPLPSNFTPSKKDSPITDFISQGNKDQIWQPPL